VVVERRGGVVAYRGPLRIRAETRPIPMKSSLLRGLAALCVLAPAAASQVDYALAFQPGGAEWNVEARMPGRGEDELEFRFPLWTPGAYHVADYGKLVTELTAADEHGAELAVERVDTDHFVISGAGKAQEIVIRWRAGSMSSGTFTNDVIDVESNRIAEDYAYVNPVSLFGFVPARAEEAVRLVVELPAGWQAATVLERDADGRWLAPSYSRFEDSPFLFSPTLLTETFEVDGKAHAVSVHGRSAEDVKTLTAGCKRIVEAGAKLMRGLPYDRYHFLFGFVEEAGGSGLEHSYSTLILVPPQIGIGEDDEHDVWGITAHEFFHLWCAERIHVQGIREPDLTAPFETGTIWVNEGITEYFCRHLLHHAGFLTQEELLQSYLDGAVPEGVLKPQSWTDVSRAAASWSGMLDIMVFALKMYQLGPRVIFALDMELRRATDGQRGVLDLLWHLDEHYVQQERGFGEEELDDILVALGGQPALAFYETYIDGEEIPDPAEWLGVIGYRAVDGELREVEKPTPEQLEARRDYFSVTGTP
jgi:predicted metalloprotease with PDZ domain